MATELKFKQIVAAGLGAAHQGVQLYGLTEGGKVWMFAGERAGWQPVNMKEIANPGAWSLGDLEWDTPGRSRA